MNYNEKVIALLQEKELTDEQRAFIERAFPELKENEGEEIRKALIDELKIINANCKLFKVIPKKRFIAWLEKQGEQKQTIIPKFRVGDTIRIKGHYDEYKITDIHDGSYYGKGWSIGIEGEDDYELVEQKPAWSKEDERLCLGLIEDQEEALDEVNNDKSGHLEIIPDLEEMYHERIKWLRTIKDRVGCEVKYTTTKERSEENEKKLNRIYMLLAEAADAHAFSTTCRLIGDKECVDLQDFLKSLRPQSTWKPSDLPHWKKINLSNHTTTGFNSDYFCHKGYYINYKELFEKLPKDE